MIYHVRSYYRLVEGWMTSKHLTFPLHHYIISIGSISIDLLTLTIIKLLFSYSKKLSSLLLPWFKAQLVHALQIPYLYQQ